MTARIVLELQISGDSDLDRSLADACEWLNRRGPHTPEYHEVMAHLALVAARDHWREADTYRRLNAERKARQARAAARTERKP